MENKMKGSNPVLRGRVFEKNYEFEKRATLEGTVNKIGFLLCLLIGAAVLSWFVDDTIGAGLLAIGVILGLILCLIISFVPKSSPFLAPIYAVMEGFALGYISKIYSEAYADGIVLQAVLLTFFIFILMLVIHSIRAIRVNQRFMTYVFVATGAIALVYMADFVMSMLGIPVTFLHATGWVGIVIIIIIIIIASFNLLIDFQFIEDASNMGVPKFFEWYLAFGLIVTLVWLYLEILKLLAKFAKSKK
jgi:uncharacterized YccA/Bax inhibitor family protein